ncbi:EAL domain-containing protein [Vibrio sp. YMD68]|uniref:PTS sugar transporter subunit IIC/EAL domain-containing protein n=1 Tax=Vibrio sp. YMD68 TaxID=3042300 RepID=UPI00249C26C5|nr:EAL domain-containing protein [Vibrio sp. YMD68]WGV99174.1 EAL domain-containing protein [Vibrio sp. YMD68]
MGMIVTRLQSTWNVVEGFSLKFITPSLLALREGMIWLLPCLMLSSFFLFFASMGEFVFGRRTEWVTSLYAIHGSIASFFPFLMTAALSYVLAMQWKLPRPPVALLSVLYLVVIGEVLPNQQSVQTFNIIIAIITPLYATPILASLLKLGSLKITRSNSGGKIVKESLNLVLPATITGVIVMVVNSLIFTGLTGNHLLSAVYLDYANEPYTFGMVFAALNSTLWFIGIHGYYALLPLVDYLQEATNLSYSTFLAGSTGPYPMNLSFMGSFVFIGGSGATLSLVVALLVFSEQKALQVIALASIPIGLINVNEILLFGLPIIFNPRLFFPFLLVPIVNVCTSMFAIQSGWVSVPVVSVPFNSPVLINAWISTNGDVGALGLQLFNVLIGTLIYLPAVRGLNKVYANRKIDFPFLDTTYTRRQEEAETLREDPIAIAQSEEKKAKSLEDQLEVISHKEFCMEYQPQICSLTGKVVGCEALVRATSSSGELVYPGAFIPWLEEAGLMKDLDVWVFKQVAKDIQIWNKSGNRTSVSINISPETLVTEDVMTPILKAIKPVASQINIEITEETLLVDEQKLMMSFNRLQNLGVKVYIDDFGTGFSSLSYLNRFSIDAIKIDRSFVLALSSEKGRKVFTSILSIATRLDISVVVEGVETLEQLSFIPKSDTISVQGWYYSRSLPSQSYREYCQLNEQLTPDNAQDVSAS